MKFVRWRVRCPAESPAEVSRPGPGFPVLLPGATHSALVDLAPWLYFIYAKGVAHLGLGPRACLAACRREELIHA